MAAEDPLHLSELALRGGMFVAILGLMFCWEASAPRHRSQGALWKRRLHNLSLIAAATLLVRLLPLASAVQAAWFAAERGWGLLAGLPAAAAFVVSLAMLDLLLYAQHMLFHKVEWLWRLHRVHHSDTRLDATTGVRFHPLEILLSALFKAAAVLALGAPVAAVICFEVLLNATSMFNHGNVALPRRLDALLRLLIVTPDMHRVHHSTRPAEHNRNYGFNLSCWDRLFGTYLERPREGLRIGMERFREARQQNVLQLLVQPLSPAAGGGARAPEERG